MNKFRMNPALEKRSRPPNSPVMQHFITAGAADGCQCCTPKSGVTNVPHGHLSLRCCFGACPRCMVCWLKCRFAFTRATHFRPPGATAVPWISQLSPVARQDLLPFATCLTVATPDRRAYKHLSAFVAPFCSLSPRDLCSLNLFVLGVLLNLRLRDSALASFADFFRYARDFVIALLSATLCFPPAWFSPIIENLRESVRAARALFDIQCTLTACCGPVQEDGRITSTSQ